MQTVRQHRGFNYFPNISQKSRCPPKWQLADENNRPGDRVDLHDRNLLEEKSQFNPSSAVSIQRDDSQPDRSPGPPSQRGQRSPLLFPPRQTGPLEVRDFKVPKAHSERQEHKNRAGVSNI